MKKVLFFLIVSVCGLAGCTQPEKAKNILLREGYTSVQITGYRFFGCSDRDTFSTGFVAFKNGQSVSGNVCSGFLKGSTVRFDD